MSNTKKLSSDDLKRQTAEAEQRLNALRQEQVEALEEGREFEHNSEIMLVSERIDALTKAVTRAERREAEARESRIRDLQRRRLLQLKDKAEQIVESRDDALLQVQAAMRTATDALKTFMKANDELSTMVGHSKPIFEQHGVPCDEFSIFHPGNVHQRISSYLSSAFANLDLAHTHVGRVSWESNPGVSGPWTDHEARATSPQFRGVFLSGIDKVLSKIPTSDDVNTAAA